jgi:hypothetical protein
MQSAVVFDSGKSEDHFVGSEDRAVSAWKLWKVVLTVPTDLADLTIWQGLPLLPRC